MNPSERRRVVRRRHVIALAPVLLAGLTACADQPAAPSLTVDLPVKAPHSPVRSLRLVAPLHPSPRATHKPAPTHKPHVKAHATPKPHIGTALTIRRLRVTAYCETGSRTYTGVWPRRGMAAVKASTGIPFGAVLHIEGRRYVVTDREPERGSSNVDLYEGWRSDCESFASNFGIHHLPVQIEAAA